MSEKHKVWMTPFPVVGDDNHQSTCMLYDEPITADQQQDRVGRVLFETVDLTPEEEQSLLQTVRSTFG